MIETKILITGAGLTGLSAAYHLDKMGFKDYLLLEKEDYTGGLCSSVLQDGFTFDWSGHLLHLHTKEGKEFTDNILGANLAFLERQAYIYSHNIFTPYPFQVNTYGLPQKVIDECVGGFKEALAKKIKVSPKSSFKDWAHAIFGTGICKHFMYPYNRKLWQVPLSELNAGWCGSFVPKVSLTDVINGSLGKNDKAFGYNAGFYYPKKGGIGALCKGIEKKISSLQTNAPLKFIDFNKKTAVFDLAGEIKYEQLINTVPLKDFISLSNAPASVQKENNKLRCASVYLLNLGIDRKISENKHWVYYPEPEYPFYRVGFADNFAKNNAPKGASSLYIETSRMQGKNPDEANLQTDILEGLKKAGLVKGTEKVMSFQWLKIPTAYVTYDNARDKAVNKILKFLKTKNINSIGRYGAWKYSFMEESILEGKQAAQEAVKKLQK